MSYYLKGEAGKAMDATLRLAGDDLKIENLEVSYENLGIDALEWTAKTYDLAASETLLPEVGQIVELYQGSLPTPTRYFRGWVTEAKNAHYGTVVRVEGPASWLSKMTIDTVQGSETRPSISFAQQSVSTSITALINRAIAMGAPIALGTIATTYTIPVFERSLETFAEVLALLMAWVPDGVAWWDYSGTGTPTFNVWRRAGLTTTSYAAGAGGELKNYAATGRPDQVPSQVSIKYRTRAASGTRQYASQNDGVAVAGQVQVIGLSGEEMSDFLPADEIEGVQVQTINANQATNLLKPAILARLPEVIESRTYFAGQPTDTRVTLANGESITTQKGAGSGGANYYISQPNLKFTNVVTGLEENRTGKHLLISPEPPEWAAAALGSAIKVRVSGRIYRLEESTLYTGFGTGGIDAPDSPAWSLAFPWNQTFLVAGYYPSSTVPGYPWARVYFVALDFEFETYLINQSFPVIGTLWKPQAFAFNSPPAGLAANLRSAQSFTPYEGKLELQRTTAPAPANLLNEKVNITGSQAELATMAAMPKRIVHKLSGPKYTTTIDLGAPERFAFGTGKIRGTSQGNITL